jgi:hypothetical protein
VPIGDFTKRTLPGLSLEERKETRRGFREACARYSDPWSAIRKALLWDIKALRAWRTHANPTEHGRGTMDLLRKRIVAQWAMVNVLRRERRRSA